jgi:hypothetical protein
VRVKLPALDKEVAAVKPLPAAELAEVRIMPVKVSRSRTLFVAAAAALVLLPGCSDETVQAGDAGADHGTPDAVSG